MLLKAEPPALHSERALVPRRDYEVLHSGHSDWVTHLQHIPGGWGVPAGGVRSGGRRVGAVGQALKQPSLRAQ